MIQPQLVAQLMQKSGPDILLQTLVILRGYLVQTLIGKHNAELMVGFSHFCAAVAKILGDYQK